MELSEQQKRKILSAAEIVDKGDFAVLEKILEFQDFLEEWELKIEALKEELGASFPTEIQNKLIEMSRELDEYKSEMEKMGKLLSDEYVDKEKQANMMAKMQSEVNSLSQIFKNGIKEVKDMIPEMPESFDPTDILNRINEIESKIPKIPDEISGEDIVDKINALPLEEDKMIDKSHIKGLEKELDKIRNMRSTGGSGGGLIGKDFIKDIDLSDQLDGVTKTFNIQVVWNIVSVDLSSYPYGSLRKGIDYTWTPTSITFTSEIDAETQLSVGQKCILTVVT